MKTPPYDLAFIQETEAKEVPAICPKVLAVKMQGIRDLKYPDLVRQIKAFPRLPELLWFIQAMSCSPGGLAQFARALLVEFPERIGTKTMAALGYPKGGKYSLQNCIQIYREHSNSAWRALRLSNLQDEQKAPWIDRLLNETHEGIKAVERKGLAEVREITERMTYDHFWKSCVMAALERLPQILAKFCNEQDALIEDGESVQCGAWAYGSPGWFFCGLVEALFLMMDRHAEKVSKQIAHTSLSKTVFRELQFCLSQGVPVSIVGDPRFGKTTAIGIWCNMRPGRARLVTVPDTNREWDFYKAHAAALGYSFNDRTPTRELKQAVEYILDQSRLAPIYDEAHFLFPQNYSATTAPKRLNWIRCQVIDKGLPCAFFATPQTYKQSLSAFVKKTGYDMEQWIGRMPPTVVLEPELSKSDLLAVARIHFPEIDADYLELMAAKAMQAEGYLKNLELTARRARFLAQEKGRAQINLEDVQEAIAYMTPHPGMADPSTARKAAQRKAARPLQTECSQPANNRISSSTPARPDALEEGNRIAALTAA